MNITEVHVRMHSRGKLRAFVTITIDDWFVVRGLKLIEKASGELFVAMPAQVENGKDICHPISQEGRQYLTARVLESFAAVEKSPESREPLPSRLASEPLRA